MQFGAVTPVLRIFDVAKATEFYIDFLGFEVQFEHRFADDLPLYMGLARGETRLHLSEHHGDGAPGAHVRILVQGIEEYHEQLLAKAYRYARPGLEVTPWDTREVRIADPFANRLVFYEPRSDV